MFTGIVQGIRKVSRITEFENGRRLCIKLDDLIVNLFHGASISVNGVCLTVVSLESNLVEFDVISESLKRSNLGTLKIGDYVNIERACRLGEEVGGHNISGHVECVGTIKQINNNKRIYDIVVKCKKRWIEYLFEKGWIAIDGISLTVVEIKDNSFLVSLIPETIKNTILGQKKEGDKVNLEFDNSAKIIVETVKRIIPEIKYKSQSQF